MASHTRKSGAKGDKARRLRRTLKRAFRKQRSSYLLKETRLGTPAARQQHYTVKIHLQTEVTGKHSLLFQKKMLVTPAAGVRYTGGGFPQLAREPGAPYARPVVKGKNKLWDQLNKELKGLVSKLFRRGTSLRFPNPSYPRDYSRDLMFSIRHAHWEPCAKPGCRTSNVHYSGPMSLGGYKFALVPEAATERRVGVALVANLQVFLEGELVKKATTPPTKKEEAKNLAGKLLSGCKGHLDELRWLVRSLHLFDESPSAAFEAQVEAQRQEMARRHAAKKPAWASSGYVVPASTWVRYIPARRFTGRRPGFVFRSGDRGTGYYEDVSGRAAAADARVSAPVGVRSSDELGGWQGGGAP